MIFSAFTIATDGTFTASTDQIVGLYVGLVVFLAFMNSLPTRLLHKFYSLYGTISVPILARLA